MGANNPLILSGSTGTGKTHDLKLLSELLNYDEQLVFNPLEELQQAVQRAAALGLVPADSDLILPGETVEWAEEAAVDSHPTPAPLLASGPAPAPIPGTEFKFVCLSLHGCQCACTHCLSHAHADCTVACPAAWAIPVRYSCGCGVCPHFAAATAAGKRRVPKVVGIKQLAPRLLAALADDDMLAQGIGRVIARHFRVWFRRRPLMRQTTFVMEALSACGRRHAGVRSHDDGGDGSSDGGTDDIDGDNDEENDEDDDDDDGDDDDVSLGGDTDYLAARQAAGSHGEADGVAERKGDDDAPLQGVYSQEELVRRRAGLLSNSAGVTQLVKDLLVRPRRPTVRWCPYSPTPTTRE
jgi:hypothetical protein